MHKRYRCDGVVRASGAAPSNARDALACLCRQLQARTTAKRYGVHRSAQHGDASIFGKNAGSCIPDMRRCFIALRTGPKQTQVGLFLKPYSVEAPLLHWSATKRRPRLQKDAGYYLASPSTLCPHIKANLSREAAKLSIRTSCSKSAASCRCMNVRVLL